MLVKIRSATDQDVFQYSEISQDPEYLESATDPQPGDLMGSETRQKRPVEENLSARRLINA